MNDEFIVYDLNIENAVIQSAIYLEDLLNVTGPTGIDGAQGPQGLQGPQGVAGSSTNTGATGPQGSQGLNGVASNTGSTGPRGIQGITGPIGISGTIGSQGVTGPTGISGTNGSQGVTGPTGIGNTGPTGPPGVITGSWILTTGANTVNFTVDGNNTYLMWVRGNIPNGICIWNATVSISNSNVPAIGTQYGWYYTSGNNLVLTSIPSQIIGTEGSISTATATIPAGGSYQFNFGITNNSGAIATVYYGYLKL